MQGMIRLSFEHDCFKWIHKGIVNVLQYDQLGFLFIFIIWGIYM
jgi:hypothetical protein